MSRATKAQLQERKDAIYTFCQEQNPVTVRGIYYHLTTLGLVPKTDNGYNRVQDTCAKMRRAGELPFQWITDNTRWMRKTRTHNSLTDALTATAETYRRDFLSFAGLYIEIWLEKDALSGVFSQVTNEWDIPLMVSRGFASLSFLHTSAELLPDGALIYIFSDYDASGEGLATSIEKGLREFSDKHITVTRALLTKEQVDAWDLPTREPKKKDKEKGFEVCAELDAIPPTQLRAEVQRCITQHCNPEALKSLRETEAAERESINQIFSYKQDIPEKVSKPVKTPQRDPREELAKKCYIELRHTGYDKAVSIESIALELDLPPHRVATWVNMYDWDNDLKL